MKIKLLFAAMLCAPLSLLAAGSMSTNDSAVDSSDAHQPHTPTLIFYLTGADSLKDVEAIHASVDKLKVVKTLEINTNHDYVRVRFDSHVVSYHQVAQAIADAGASLGKEYDPFLVFFVNGYALSNNVDRVDAIFDGKRLNTRVKVTMIDRDKGLFAVHFLPLVIAPGQTGLSGFNGGHLHHPISDPVPRGLALTSGYASEYDPSLHIKQNQPSP